MNYVSMIVPVMKGAIVADYLLDTTAIIRHLRGDEHVVSLLTDLVRQGHRLCSCCVTIAETYAGMREHEREKTERLIDSLLYRDITPAISKQAGTVRATAARKGLTVATTDALIAATALAHKLTIITGNAKHYPIEGLTVIEH